jgi:nicotinamidase/pyrazinamidase
MRKTGKILIFTAALVLCILGLLICQLVLLSRPTHGEKITRYANPRKAVLVIDIQEDYTGTTAKPPFPYRDSAKLIATVNALTGAASGKNILVVYIRQELDGFWGRLLSNWFCGGAAIRGNPGTEIDRRIAINSSHLFPKPRSDAFSNPEFGKFLIDFQVDELYLVGLDADGCVHATARGALNRGYAVNIITDAVVLREENKWEKLLKIYREEGITLVTSRDFFKGNP